MASIPTAAFQATHMHENLRREHDAVPHYVALPSPFKYEEGGVSTGLWAGLNSFSQYLAEKRLWMSQSLVPHVCVRAPTMQSPEITPNVTHN